jgi:hypothetical protein
MPAKLSSERRPHFSELLRNGVGAGIAGGLAEVIVVALYGAASGTTLATVGRQIASAARLNGDSALTGLCVHFALSAALGIALMFAWNLLRTAASRPAALYWSACLALTAIWAINFFIVLPALSPAFVTLLPYAVTLVSKLMFGCAAAWTMQLASVAGANGKGDKPATDTSRLVSIVGTA